MEGVKRRFDRIIEKYLKPAGYEIQKAQQEYEQLLQGKELYDKDIAILLENADNNNDRYEILLKLRDYVIPNYNTDTLPAVYDGLKGHLLLVVKAARGTERSLIESTNGPMEGFKTDDITKLVVEIIEYLRYVDVVATLQLLIAIYRDESNEDIRRQIVNVVKNLSEYNIDAYNQVGPMIQTALVDHLAGMNDIEVDDIRPIALTIWSEAIQSDITGAKWKADSMVLSTGAVPVSDYLKEVRDKAIKSLFAAYDRSSGDVQKRAVLSALDAAARTPNHTQYSNELLAITLMAAKRIVDFLTERATAERYELLQHVEHQFLYDYFRAKDLTEDPESRFGCQEEAAALMAAILQFRDKINADNRYVRYKVLVGFESVYPHHWIEKKYDYLGDEEYRNGEAHRYIDDINASNENYFFDLITRCAETKSNDLATFPVFGNYISKLAERKPEVVDRFVAKGSDDLRNFLAGFLNGLALSGRGDIYERILESELESAKNLSGIARHLRYSNVAKSDFAARLLRQAIDKGDSIAVIECLLFALEHYGTEKISDADTFASDALTFLNDNKDTRWVSGAWFLQKATKFYEELTPERTAQILQNLSYLSQVNYQVEIILVRLAERQPEAIWDYFGVRLSKAAEKSEDEERYEAVPFKFHSLHKEFSKNPQLAINKGLSWYATDQQLFKFRGGRILSNAFPKCPQRFAATLAELVKNGGDTETDFALEILQNYEGEITTHVVLKEIVSRFPDDKSKMNRVRIAIEAIGVVTGDLGFAEAYRSKQESLQEWLADGRLTVKVFAEKHIAELDRMIASEHRRAETDREMRKREYDEENEESDHDDSNGGKSKG
jgi:hypothetical protein